MLELASKVDMLELSSTSYHGLGRQVGLEFSTDNATVTMRSSDLAPNAAVMRPILLHLGLVDVSHAFAAVPCHILLGVHSLNLDQ